MATGDLTTLANVKDWLALPESVTGDDDLLTRLITAVSGFIGTYLSRNLLTASYTETRNGNDQVTLPLVNRPVTAVSSLTINGVVINAAPPLVANAPVQFGYLFDDKVVYLAGWCFKKGFQNIVISYTAGYATVPLEVEQAAIELVCRKYRYKKRIGLVSEAMKDGGTMTYSLKDMDEDTRTILNAYRRTGLVTS